MAYPEPILPLRGKAAKQFVERLESFRLTKKQKEFYRGVASAFAVKQESSE